MDFKLGLEVDTKMYAHNMKEQAIETFNEAHKKGASKAFMKSLYRQTLFDLSEYNSMLGMLPQDGISRLTKEWDK